MLRKLALSLAVSAALGASQANALGLGEIRVNSALNEPLDAEIRLTQVRDLSPLQIQPKMASLDEYAAGNTTLARYLRDIQFQVLVSPEGTGRIRMKSIDPVLEPFLNFMVEVNWPSGRLVREYTLLLDPPVFDAAPAVRPISVAAPEPVLQPVEKAVDAPAPVRQPKAANPRTRSVQDGQIHVGSNDTLWRLSARNKPAGTTEHQMMLALLHKNPQSFLSGNINGLKAGTVMQVPTRDEVQAVSHKEAVAEIARQMQLWRDGKAGADTQAAAPVDVSKGASKRAEPTDVVKPVETPSKSAAEQSKLSIVAPTETVETGQTAPAGESVDTSATEGAAAAADSEQVITDVSRQIENEVLMAQEQIDVLERENADLNNTLNSVMEQLESQSRMIELQSQQMATLQAELDRKAAQPPAKSEQSLMGLLDDPVVLGGVGAGALALLAGLWMALRRRGSDTSDSKRELVSVPDNLRDDDTGDGGPALSAAAVAGGALAGGAAAGAVLATADDDETKDEMPPRPAPLSADEDEEEFSRPPMQALAPEEPEVAQADDLNDDLQSLDLDMDLDLDDLDTASEAVSEPAADPVAELDAAEFDLSADDLDTLGQMDELVPEQKAEEPELPAVEEVAQEEPVELADTDLDQELEFNVAPLAEDDDDAADLDALLSGSDTEELDFMLQSDDETDIEVEPSTDDADDAVDDLEALLAGSLGESDVTEKPAPATATADDADNSLHETVDTHDDLDFEIDSDLEAMLAGSADDDDDKPFGGSGGEAASDSAVDDLDSLLADFNPELDVEADAPSRALVEEELTSNISHDLEMDLDAEVDEMLSSTDNEIELSEEHNEEALEILDKMNLLSGADETETKLDLARAYLEMEDQEGARDILEEITSEGSAGQKEEARKLLESLD